MEGKIIFYALVIVLIIAVSGCSKEIVCNSPYMRMGTGCCLDTDNNSICDDDEKIEINSTNETNQLEVNEPENVSVSRQGNKVTANMAMDDSQSVTVIKPDFVNASFNIPAIYGFVDADSNSAVFRTIAAEIENTGDADFTEGYLNLTLLRMRSDDSYEQVYSSRLKIDNKVSAGEKATMQKDIEEMLLVRRYSENADTKFRLLSDLYVNGNKASGNVYEIFFTYKNTIRTDLETYPSDMTKEISKLIFMDFGDVDYLRSGSRLKMSAVKLDIDKLSTEFLDEDFMFVDLFVLEETEYDGKHVKRPIYYAHYEDELITLNLEEASENTIELPLSLKTGLDKSYDIYARLRNRETLELVASESGYMRTNCDDRDCRVVID
jgi:hypothetical protein